MKKNYLLYFLALIIIFILLLIAYSPREIDEEEKNNISEVVLSDLDIPWEVEFINENELLITERTGNLVHVRDGKNKIKVNGVRHNGEGGLLGMALHPDFKNNNYIYLYFTSNKDGTIENRVERYKIDLVNDELTERKIIIEDIPGASYHDGGRIKFGGDGYLYISTGDAGNEDNAQDINSLAGKILRLDDEGGNAVDNPFGNAVYSYGHRNIQGISWDDSGRLWASEHGRSGIQSGLDELNIIEKGKNYGWPIIQGEQREEDMQSPLIHSGDDTWAPSGTAYYKGRIYFAGLRGESLYFYDIERKELKELFKGEFGRLRGVLVRGDSVYIWTNNRDGRGNERDGDDKLIKLNIDL